MFNFTHADPTETNWQPLKRLKLPSGFVPAFHCFSVALFAARSCSGLFLYVESVRKVTKRPHKHSTKQDAAPKPLTEEEQAAVAAVANEQRMKDLGDCARTIRSFFRTTAPHLLAASAQALASSKTLDAETEAGQDHFIPEMLPSADASSSSSSSSTAIVGAAASSSSSSSSSFLPAPVQDGLQNIANLQKDVRPPFALPSPPPGSLHLVFSSSAVLILPPLAKRVFHPSFLPPLPLIPIFSVFLLCSQIAGVGEKRPWYPSGRVDSSPSFQSRLSSYLSSELLAPPEAWLSSPYSPHPPPPSHHLPLSARSSKKQKMTATEIQRKMSEGARRGGAGAGGGAEEAVATITKLRTKLKRKNAFLRNVLFSSSSSSSSSSSQQTEGQGLYQRALEEELEEEDDEQQQQQELQHEGEGEEDRGEEGDYEVDENALALLSARSAPDLSRKNRQQQQLQQQQHKVQGQQPQEWQMKTWAGDPSASSSSSASSSLPLGAIEEQLRLARLSEMVSE